MEYNLNRFIEAQNNVYEQVTKELKQGRKTSHWMWFIFPQIQGLGSSPMAQLYAIHSSEEATEYLNNPILGNRLIECCQILLGLENHTAEDIFGSVDAMKLKSSMTLFSLVSDNPIFNKVLALYYNGEKDRATLKIVGFGNPDQLPLKDSFKSWLIEEGVSISSANSYCSYVSGACKDMRVKYRGHVMYVFEVIQLFIDKKDAETIYDVMMKVIHLFYSDHYLKRIARPQATINNWRTGLGRYREFVIQYLDQEVQTCNINNDILIFEDEDITSENTIEITKDELYDNFNFRLITQDRYYENIMYPIGLIKRLFFKTNRRAIFNKYINTMIDNILIHIEEGTVSMANVKSLYLDIKKEGVYVLMNDDKKLQVFSPIHENKNVPLKVKSLSQISLDHIVPMYNLMTQNEEKLSEMLKLTQVIRDRIKGKINCKAMRDTYSSIIKDADNLEEYIDFSQMEKEMTFLFGKGNLQLMDRCENTRKGKK